MRLRIPIVLLCVVACDGSPAAMELDSGDQAQSADPPPHVVVRAHQDATVREIWETKRLLFEAGATTVSVLPHDP